MVIALIFMLTNLLLLKTTPAVSYVNKKTVQMPQQNISQGAEDALKADIAQHEAIGKPRVSPPLDTFIESADDKRERLISAALRVVNSKNVESRVYRIPVQEFYDPDIVVSEIYQAFARINSIPI